MNIVVKTDMGTDMDTDMDAEKDTNFLQNSKFFFAFSVSSRKVKT